MNIRDDEKLNHFFGGVVDLDNLDTPVIDVGEKSLVKSPENFQIPMTTETDIDHSLNDLLAEAKDMMSHAKRIMINSVDSEAINACASLINSISGIISELNKPLMKRKDFEMKKEMEKIKTDLKKELMSEKTKKGDMNVQNNFFAFRQEDVVKMMKKIKEDDQKTIEQ